MKTGTVEKIEQRQTKGGPLYALNINGKELTFFADSDVELGDISEGDEVEYSTKQNGPHTNITEIGLLEKGEPSEVSEAKEMKKGAALKTAGRVVESPEDVEKWAKRFYQLLNNGDWSEEQQ